MTNEANTPASPEQRSGPEGVRMLLGLMDGIIRHQPTYFGRDHNWMNSRGGNTTTPTVTEGEYVVRRLSELDAQLQNGGIEGQIRLPLFYEVQPTGVTAEITEKLYGALTGKSLDALDLKHRAQTLASEGKTVTRYYHLPASGELEGYGVIAPTEQERALLTETGELEGMQVRLGDQVVVNFGTTYVELVAGTQELESPLYARLR